MATACILMVIGATLLFSGTSDARPRYEYSGEQSIDDAENNLKGIPTKNDVNMWHLKYNRHQGFKRVIPWSSDGHQFTESRFETSSTEAPTTKITLKPVFGRDRILDQLHDHTGDKQPMYHSAVDGWVF
ncbi:hypothetical protein GE061_019335 [Apolygus lucorum]|uniref:Uncharacterized protein n=1 Tax=Apolygus lucorum TaxID=248454 RepID=A0A6A4JV46_APOLU|nr:hypothetical protein GE061_019335 [Apolygus lucorum]